MGKDIEDTVTAFLASFHDPNGADLDRTVSYLAENGSYQVLVPATTPLQGVPAIRAALAKQFDVYKDCVCEIHAIASNDRVVFTERSDHVTLLHDGRRMASRVCAVFVLNDDGKIEAWREYWDTGDVLRQMGVDRAVLEASIS